MYLQNYISQLPKNKKNKLFYEFIALVRMLSSILKYLFRFTEYEKNIIDDNILIVVYNCISKHIYV